MISFVIESAGFPNVYLRMDGQGVTSSTGSGGGTVNCQFGAGPLERFKIYYLPDGTYSIESLVFPNVYLRMDGQGITSFMGSGGGTVNCQFGVGPWEKFRIHYLPDGTYSIESAVFPNVYLRMDGQGVTSFIGSGGGTVNCQFGAGPWERFRITSVID